MPTNDPWADKPDRFDRADREWASRWADEPLDGDAEETEPSGPGYENKEVTAKGVRDAYKSGMLAAGPHLGFGIQLGASMLLFVGVGIAVDRWLGTAPWGVIVGAALGMVGIVTMVLRVAREANTRRR